MFACVGCPSFQVIPDFDIDGEVFYYSLCHKGGRVVNNGYHEYVKRPAWCPDIRAEQVFLNSDEHLFNPVLRSVDVIEYRLQLILAERSKSFNVDNYQNIRNIY
jgi:hypothetical protein